MSFMPPVACESCETVPEQTVLSSSWRNEVAIECFLSAKSFRCARISLTVGTEVLDESFLVGCVRGFFFLGLGAGLAYASSLLLVSSRSIPPIIFVMSSRHCCFFGDTSFFAGEWRSFHSFTTSGFQNASRLGRRSGAFGMSGFFFEGETSFMGLGGASGGVAGRDIGGALQGERFLVGVGELRND